MAHPAFISRTPEECAHLITWHYIASRRAHIGWALDRDCYHKAKMSRIKLAGPAGTAAVRREALENLAQQQGWKRIDGNDGIVVVDGMRIEEFVSYFTIPGATT